MGDSCGFRGSWLSGLVALGELGMDVRGSKELGVLGLKERFQPPSPAPALFPCSSPRSWYPPARLSSRVSGRKAPAQFQALRAAQAPAYLWCSLSGRWVCGDGGRA